MTGPRIQIGALAEQAGVSCRTIRYYERIGLLQPARREGTGYRYYDRTSIERLDKIAALKRLGLSLEEIGQVIELYFRDETIAIGKETLLAILKRHLAETDRRLAEFSGFREELVATIGRIEAQLAAIRGLVSSI